MFHCRANLLFEPCSPESNGIRITNILPGNGHVQAIRFGTIPRANSQVRSATLSGRAACALSAQYAVAKFVALENSSRKCRCLLPFTEDSVGKNCRENGNDHCEITDLCQRDRYSYVTDDPINLADSSGACPRDSVTFNGRMDCANAQGETDPELVSENVGAYSVWVTELSNGDSHSYLSSDGVIGYDIQLFPAGTFGFWNFPGDYLARQTKPSGSAKPTLLYCEPDVIAAMKQIWEQSANGTSGAEASFSVNGNSSNYKIVFNPFTNERSSQTFQIVTGGASPMFAIFHVHPNTSTWQPSTPGNNYEGNTLGDTGLADRFQLQMYVVSQQGLGFYDPKTKATTQLRKGLD